MVGGRSPRREMDRDHKPEEERCKDPVRFFGSSLGPSPSTPSSGSHPGFPGRAGFHATPRSSGLGKQVSTSKRTVSGGPLPDFPTHDFELKISSNRQPPSPKFGVTHSMKQLGTSVPSVWKAPASMQLTSEAMGSISRVPSFFVLLNAVLMNAVPPQTSSPLSRVVHNAESEQSPCSSPPGHDGHASASLVRSIPNVTNASVMAPRVTMVRFM